MSTLKVGAIQSTTGNAAMTVANTGNLTIPGSTTFSGSVTDVIKKSSTVTFNGNASASITSGISTTAKVITLLLHDVSTSDATNVRYRVRANGADITSSTYELNAWYGDHAGSFQNEDGGGDHFKFHSDWAGANNTYNTIISFYNTHQSSGLVYTFQGKLFNRGAGGSNYSVFAFGLAGRISLSHAIDGFTVYTANGNNFDSGSMSVITQE
tara:strand:+ start:672 stop:1304 length:633 start_codon:yes stop_codon:yes gene_type:complete